MLKAHYALKCTSWVISPDLLRASVTPPTTAACVAQAGSALVQRATCPCEGNSAENLMARGPQKLHAQI